MRLHNYQCATSLLGLLSHVEAATNLTAIVKHNSTWNWNLTSSSPTTATLWHNQTSTTCSPSTGQSTIIAEPVNGNIASFSNDRPFSRYETIYMTYTELITITAYQVTTLTLCEAADSEHSQTFRQKTLNPNSIKSASPSWIDITKDVTNEQGKAPDGDPRSQNVPISSAPTVQAGPEQAYQPDIGLTSTMTIPSTNDPTLSQTTSHSALTSESSPKRFHTFTNHTSSITASPKIPVIPTPAVSSIRVPNTSIIDSISRTSTESVSNKTTEVSSSSSVNTNASTTEALWSTTLVESSSRSRSTSSVATGSLTPGTGVTSSTSFVQTSATPAASSINISAASSGTSVSSMSESDVVSTSTSTTTSPVAHSSLSITTTTTTTTTPISEPQPEPEPKPRRPPIERPYCPPWESKRYKCWDVPEEEHPDAPYFEHDEGTISV